MDNKKLINIIENKNEQLEQNALRTAVFLIEAIVTNQKNIAKAEKNIEELRTELAELEVKTIDAKTVLG